MNLDYRQGEFRAVETIFGFQNDVDSMVQEIGKIVTRVSTLKHGTRNMQMNWHLFIGGATVDIPKCSCS